MITHGVYELLERTGVMERECGSSTGQSLLHGKPRRIQSAYGYLDLVYDP
jgi:hypothetical protein